MAWPGEIQTRQRSLPNTPTLKKQPIDLSTPTRAFQKEGWKRMNMVWHFFYDFAIDIREGFYADTFKLSYLQVGHPNSAANAKFYPTAISLGIIASPQQIPPRNFDSALAKKHYVIVRD